MSELYRPLCGEQEVHEPHDHWSGDATLMYHCLGLTGQQQQIHDMIRTVWNATQDVPEVWKDAMRVEIHPAVNSLILRELTQTFGEAVLGEQPQLTIPVVVTTDLSWGGWRIVLARGEIRDDRLG